MLRKIRVAHARRALRDGDGLIAAVCFDAGFNNLSNFNRQFIRETGMTPRAYRNQARPSG